MDHLSLINPQLCRTFFFLRDSYFLSVSFSPISSTRASQTWIGTWIMTVLSFSVVDCEARATVILDFGNVRWCRSRITPYTCVYTLSSPNKKSMEIRSLLTLPYSVRSTRSQERSDSSVGMKNVAGQIICTTSIQARLVGWDAWIENHLINHGLVDLRLFHHAWVLRIQNKFLALPTKKHMAPIYLNFNHHHHHHHPTQYQTNNTLRTLIDHYHTRKNWSSLGNIYSCAIQGHQVLNLYTLATNDNHNTALRFLTHCDVTRPLDGQKTFPYYWCCLDSFAHHRPNFKLILCRVVDRLA